MQNKPLLELFKNSLLLKLQVDKVTFRIDSQKFDISKAIDCENTILGSNKSPLFSVTISV